SPMRWNVSAESIWLLTSATRSRSVLARSSRSLKDSGPMIITTAQPLSLYKTFENLNPISLTVINLWKGLRAVLAKDPAAIHEDNSGRVASKEVRELTVVGAIVDHEIGELARFERAKIPAASQTVGGVDCSGGDRLSGGQTRCRAGAPH